MSELCDVRGRVLDASYCSCRIGEQRRIDDDTAAATVIAAANHNLTHLSRDTLVAVRRGLLNLDPATI